MKPSKIFVTLDHNEIMRPRAEKVERAVLEDDGFEMHDPGSLPFDLRFVSVTECPQCHGVPYPEELNEHHGIVVHPICGVCLGKNSIRKTMHVELKDFSEDANSDYLASIRNGHLYEQILAARERHEPLAVVVLGDDNDVGAAIRKTASRATAGYIADPDKLMEYYHMVEGFEANCIALGVPIWRLKTDPYRRMLLRVRKILEGGDLSGFAPAPAEGERQAVGLSILAGKGIGPAKAAGILKKFKICMYPTSDDTYLDDCDGIGPKLAPSVGRALNVPLSLVSRPPKPKKSKAKATGATA